MTGPRFELLLVRHGLTDWNENGRLLGRIDIGLNARGRVQAEAASSALARLEVDALYSSPQLRTRETAEPIARELALDVRIEPGLDEVWLQPAWQGKTVAELRGNDDLEALIVNPMHRSSAIEPIQEVQQRGVAAVERMRAAYPSGTVIAVSHGDPLRAIVAHYLALALKNFRHLTIDNGSISHLHFTPKGPKLKRLNWGPGLNNLTL